MRKTGLIIILIVFMGILPVNAKIGTNTPEIKNTEIQYYETYNKYLDRDKKLLITEEYYEVQYKVGETWVSINDPKGLNKTDSKTIQNHQNYSVVYNPLVDGAKADVIINPGISAEYRIIWNVKGLKGTPIWLENGLQIQSKDAIVELNWDDVASTKGEISEPTYNNGYLQVIFNIGFLNSGETYTLDPAIVVSYTSGNTNYTGMQNRHPSLNATVSAVAQTFNVTGDDFNIGNVTLYLAANGNPTADISLYLYDITDTYGVNATPTGNYLAVSEPYNTTPLGVANAFVNFTFIGANQYKCLTGNQYALVLQAPATTDAGIYNKANYVVIYIDNTAPTYSGNWATYNSAGWTGSAAIDMYFIIYEVTFWNQYAEIIDEAFNYFGIANYMNQITTHITGLSTYFATSLTRALELIIQQFRIINEVYNFFLYWTTALIGIALDFSEFYHQVLDGTSPWLGPLYTIGDIWDFIGYDTWAPAMPMLLLVVWVITIGERGTKTVGGETQVFLNDLNMAISLISYFVSIFYLVANTIIDRVYGLIAAMT